MNQNDTIAAISTPYGAGGLGVIRISGKNAIAVADKVFLAANRKKLSQADTHTLHYGHITDEDTAAVIDEVMAGVMRAPRTFTGEDVVEISAHGSMVGLRRILTRLIEAGARLAEAGEFTKRAFLNGRLDLAQAEAVIDIINAGNDAALQNAVAQLEGTLSREIRKIREPLLYVCAQFAAMVDYPDDEIAELSEEGLRRILHAAISDCETLLESAPSGRMIKEGVLCVIAGKPNAGKSSLLNALSHSERAIVTEIEGTTRDILEEFITINGVPIRLVDTAGLRDAKDAVEKIGVSRTRQYIDAAQLVLVMLDGSAHITEQDRDVLALTDGKKRILLLNKSDLEVKIKADAVQAMAPEAPIISVSAVSGEGIAGLKNAIASLCDQSGITPTSAALSNLRHAEAVAEALRSLQNALDTLDGGIPMDMCVIDVTGAVEALGLLTGETVSADIVDKIFAEFCVGK